MANRLACKKRNKGENNMNTIEIFGHYYATPTEALESVLWHMIGNEWRVIELLNDDNMPGLVMICNAVCKRSLNDKLIDLLIDTVTGDDYAEYSREERIELTAWNLADYCSEFEAPRN